MKKTDDETLKQEWLAQRIIPMGETSDVYLPLNDPSPTYDDMVYRCLHRLYLSALGVCILREQERTGILEVLDLVVNERNVQMSLAPLSASSVDPTVFWEGET